MPVRTVEQLKQKESGLKKALAGQGQTSDVGKRRRLRKRLRRTQRRRRRLVARAPRATPQADAKETPAG